MGPSPSWTQLSNLRLMAHYLSLCTGNLHILNQYLQWDSHHHLSANLVSSTPSAIGPQQCVASLSCSNRKRTTSGRLSPNANILNGLWTRWRKDSTGLPVRSLMGLPTNELLLCNVRMGNRIIEKKTTVIFSSFVLSCLLFITM